MLLYPRRLRSPALPAGPVAGPFGFVFTLGLPRFRLPLRSSLCAVRHDLTTSPDAL